MHVTATHVTSVTLNIEKVSDAVVTFGSFHSILSLYLFYFFSFVNVSHRFNTVLFRNIPRNPVVARANVFFPENFDKFDHRRWSFSFYFHRLRTPPMETEIEIRAKFDTTREFITSSFGHFTFLMVSYAHH